MESHVTNGIVRNSLAKDATGTPTTIGESSNSDLSQELLEEEDMTGICECGTCTVSTFLQHIPCPHPSQVPALSLPYLDIAHLDPVQRQLLLGRLYLEYKSVSGHLSQLKNDTHQLILKKKMTFTSLSRIIAKLESFMPSLPQDDKTAEIKKTRTINQLFTLLPDQSSFLDYHIFEDLASELQDTELKEKVESYKKLLEAYCKRSVFGCPCYSPSGKTGHSNFIIELHKNRSGMSIQELLVIQEQLCGVMGVVSNTLCPCTVSKIQSGNVQVVFVVPNYVKDVLLPLNAEQETAMRDLGFLGWSFYSGLDMACDPAQLASQLLATNSSSTMNNHHQDQPTNRVDDVSSEDDEEDDSLPRKKLKPAPGKKTRGRVKIPMEYIKNKLRRYTTFSKRKSNIMKKAYELSTLTGTQVMLMVASETGHVYTFATPKLQPMITSEAGKALIQTCLHQPDPASTSSEGNSSHRVRMSSSGYEETDLGGYLPGAEDGRNKVAASLSSSAASASSSSATTLIPSTTSTVNHRMPSIYNPPPPSLPPALASELLPPGILQSLVTSSAHSSLLPPPLISPEGYSPGTAEEGERGREVSLDNPPSPTS